MDDRTQYTITLADGTAFTATSDGAGNLVTNDDVSESMFTEENTSSVTYEADDEETYTAFNQVLRGFYTLLNGNYCIRLGDMTDIEKLQAKNAALQEANDMLTECILEMSEIVYGE